MSDVRLRFRQLNELLSAYIEIHTDIFAGSIRCIMPIPGIFKRIDFAAHEANLKMIGNEIEGLAESFRSLPSEHPGTSQAVAAVHAYTHALKDAVAQLRAICVRVKAKADGLPYPMQEYRRDVRAYKRSVQEYYSLGEQMNAAFSILRVQFA